MGGLTRGGFDDTLHKQWRATLLNGQWAADVTKWQRNRNKSRRLPMLNPLSHWFRIVLFVNPDDEDDRTGKNVMTLGATYAKLHILHSNPPRLIKHDH